jgi:hypothetical protein
MRDRDPKVTIPAMELQGFRVCECSEVGHALNRFALALLDGEDPKECARQLHATAASLLGIVGDAHRT